MTEKKIKIVYFIYLRPNKWEIIAKEQLDLLKKSKLYDLSSEIYVSVITEGNEFDKFEKFIHQNYPKLKIKDVFKENLYEYVGFKTIYEISDDDSIVLYFHSKGIFSGEKNSNNNRIRKMLFNTVIEDYEKYINEFKKNKELDIGTILPHHRGFAFYNFFWIRGDYVKKYLKKPVVNDNRFIWEEWIGNPNSTKQNIITYSPLIQYDKIVDKNKLYELRDELLKNVS